MLTQARLKQLLSYNPETGDWIWISAPLRHTHRIGTSAGCITPEGRLAIRIGGQSYLASRLAFLYMTGEWPKEVMDHINRDPGDDRWCNLREATSSENNFNRTIGNGYRGIRAKGKKWVARVANGIYLGIFDTVEEAVAARDVAASQIAGNFASLNRKE